MADPDKKVNLTCVAGEDPTNPRTKGAIATIYNTDTGVSLYHLSPKEAKTGPIDSALEGFISGYKGDKSGNFYFSQPEGTPNRNPLFLQPGFNAITTEFSGGKLSSCRIDSGNDPESSMKVDISDKIPGRPAAPPAPASGPKRVAEASPSLDMTTA